MSFYRRSNSYQATVTLSDAQIKAIHASPITIVSAPLSSQILLPILSFWVLDIIPGQEYGGVNAAAFDFQITWGNNVYNATVDAAVNLTVSSSAQAFVLPPLTGWANEFTLSLVSGKALTISSDTASALTDGGNGNTLKVTVDFFVINL